MVRFADFAIVPSRCIDKYIHSPIHVNEPERHSKKGSHIGCPSTYWSGRRVSNSRPQPWQCCALPTELLPLGVQIVWRRGSESNRPRRLCRPLHNRFATSPEETIY